MNWRRRGASASGSASREDPDRGLPHWCYYHVRNSRKDIALKKHRGKNLKMFFALGGLLIGLSSRSFEESWCSQQRGRVSRRPGRPQRPFLSARSVSSLAERSVALRGCRQPRTKCYRCLWNEHSWHPTRRPCRTPPIPPNVNVHGYGQCECNRSVK